jgi:hypothetical protein
MLTAADLKVDLTYDDQAFGLVSSIERSILRLDLDSQAQFVALTNAIEVQLESGRPDPQVVRLLGRALLTLADVRGVDRNKLKLDHKIDKLQDRIDGIGRRP